MKFFLTVKQLLVHYYIFFYFRFCTISSGQHRQRYISFLGGDILHIMSCAYLSVFICSLFSLIFPCLKPFCQCLFHVLPPRHRYLSLFFKRLFAISLFLRINQCWSATILINALCYAALISTPFASCIINYTSLQQFPIFSSIFEFSISEFKKRSLN